MKTHTPGPWLAIPTTAISRNPDSLRMDIVTTTGEWTPAFVAGDILPEDARLIASAPDLLSALEFVSGILSQPVFRNDSIDSASSSIMRNDAKVALNHIANTIAKAKGHL
jgi:hypothetical protein